MTDQATGPTRAYSTDLGVAWHGDAVDVLLEVVEPGSVDLVVTSPPFALHRQKEYGNEPSSEYVKWFMPFADAIWKVLKDSGSLVIDLGGAWQPGVPVKSIYSFELLVALCTRSRRPFVLAQDFYWYNPARLPTPAQWVTVERVRAKDAVNTVWWLAKTSQPKADNRKVLRPYTKSMERLLQTGEYNRGRRPSGHVIREGFMNDSGGAIPPNLLEISNTSNDGRYVEACREKGLKPHPARFPAELPRFFIEMLTDAGDLVVDPFAGSNVTGEVAETLNRRWVAADAERDYVLGSQLRFANLQRELAA